MPGSIAQLKRKLRQLKKAEIRIRFGGQTMPEGVSLMWDSYFSTKGKTDKAAKYTLDQLIQMNKQTIKEVYQAYFYAVYFQSYKENGRLLTDLYDPELLSAMDLSPDAGIDGIKRRFRELAKKHHPDHGGDSEKFIELVDTYDRLMKP